MRIMHERLIKNVNIYLRVLILNGYIFGLCYYIYQSIVFKDLLGILLRYYV